MDKNYWNEFYKQLELIEKESLFARFVLPYLKEKDKVMDLGCGNGRDSMFFYQNGMEVTAMDASEVAIEGLEKKFGDAITLLNGDFVEGIGSYKEFFDCLYSRFTIHSITSKQQEALLENAAAAVKKDGLFCIEVRSVKDEIYGKGQKVEGERDAYIYDNHYRRFIVLSELQEELEKSGFDVFYARESDEFAPWKQEKPIVIRILARKL